MTRPSLSVCIITQDMAHFIGHVLRQVSRFADEILVVDGGSGDGTPEIAATFDRVRVFHRAFEGNMAGQKNFAIDHACCDWVLVVDSDELLGDRLVERLPRLLKNETITHYKFARYWLVDANPYLHVRSEKHYPDFQLRLFRNQPFFRYTSRSAVHTHFPREGRGLGRKLARCHIFHFDFMLKGREARKEKVRRYIELDPASAVTSQMYLFEDMKHDIRPCRESLSGYDWTDMEFVTPISRTR